MPFSIRFCGTYEKSGVLFMFFTKTSFESGEALIGEGFCGGQPIIIEIGWSVPKRGTVVIPRVCETYLIHAIYEGYGTFNGVSVKAGEGFLIRSGELHSFNVTSDGWKHCWIRFYGDCVKKILKEKGIDDTCGKIIFHTGATERIWQMTGQLFFDHDSGISDPFGQLSLLYYFFYSIKSGESAQIVTKAGKESYVERAVNFIRNHYDRELSVSEIAGYVNLSQKYLWRIFKEQTGMSPQHYLLVTRMNAAQRLLLNSELKISSIARSVGYDNALNFAQAYKRIYGETPSDYRNGLKD